MKIIETYIVKTIGIYTKAYLCEDELGNKYYFIDTFDKQLMDIDKNLFDHLKTTR